MKLQALFLCALFVSSCTQQSAPKKHINKPPNIIIVLTDDQGFKDVGFNGSQDILTPNIDKLAKQGTLYDNEEFENNVGHDHADSNSIWFSSSLCRCTVQ